MVSIEIWIVPTPFVPASTRCLDSWAYDAALNKREDAYQQKKQIGTTAKQIGGRVGKEGRFPPLPFFP